MARARHGREPARSTGIGLGPVSGRANLLLSHLELHSLTPIFPTIAKSSVTPPSHREARHPLNCQIDQEKEIASFDSCKILLNRPRTCLYLTGRLWFSYNVGEEVEAGVEVELCGDEGGDGLRRGHVGAGGVGPYVIALVHVHGFCNTVVRQDRAWATAASLDVGGVARGVRQRGHVATEVAPYT
jgi:hypothetical protein